MKTKLLIPFFAWIAVTISPAVEVDAEAQRLLGIETTTLGTSTLKPEVPVQASILSPAGLIDVLRQIETAAAAVEVSKETTTRAEKLFGSGELVARKDVQAAQAQQVQSQAILRGLEDRLILEWGMRLSQKPAAERVKLIDALLTGTQSLARLSLSRSAPFAGKPVAVQLRSFAKNGPVFHSGELFSAPTVDPAFQAQTFFCLLESTVFLPAGLMLTGSLEVEGKVTAGVFFPQDAVVFHMGAAIAYQKVGEHDFERMVIPLDHPVNGGWFVAEGVLKSENIVIKGAQAILSKEALAPAIEED